MIVSELDVLNQEVTSAIWFAEGLERVNSEHTPGAYTRVSFAEQRLAMKLEHASAEWRIAWRGAVQAAVKAGDMERARNLFEHLKANFQIGPEFVGELEALLS